MKPITPYPRDALRYHEAGHAVVGHVLGWAVKKIVIHGPKGNAAGTAAEAHQFNRPAVTAAAFGNDYDRRERAFPKMLTRIQTIMAGPIAEEMFTGKPVRGDAGDMFEASDWAEAATGSEPEADALIRWAVERTVNRLGTAWVWVCVRRVAAALKASGGLTRPQFLKVINLGQSMEDLLKEDKSAERHLVRIRLRPTPPADVRRLMWTWEKMTG